jgi:hypothetical protein
MLGPIEILFLLAAWALPIAVLVWFVRSVTSIRDILRRIERRLDSIATTSSSGTHGFRQE